MRPNPRFSQCFRSLQPSRWPEDVRSPKSPSSVILVDETQDELNTMFAVTKTWLLENDFLLPTRPHLHDYCRRVATLLQGDRIVCFICKSPESVGSCSVSVHLSRIQTQGGKLLELVSPNMFKSSSKLFEVQIQESALGMLAISDYLYRAHIDFGSLDLSDAIEIASAAKRWECHDLFIGSLLHIVQKQRLNEPCSLRETVSFRWLPQAPPVFMQYFCARIGVVLPQLSFLQLVDVLHSAYLTSTSQVCAEVLQFITVHDLVQTKSDARLLLTFFNEIPIPSNFKAYFAEKLARFFFQLYPPEGNASDKLYSDKDENDSTDLEYEYSYSDSTPCFAVRKGVLIKLLHRNMILWETLRRINDSSSIAYDAKSMFWTILYFAEPLISDKNKLIALLRQICASMEDRESLLSDASAWNNLSAYGMRLAALSLCSRRSYSSALQLAMHISCDSLMSGSAVNNAVGSIDGLKFELKARSTSKRICSWRLYYSNVKGCFEPKTGSYARVTYELVSSNCCCDDVPGLERRTKVRLGDRNFRNGSIRNLHTEGELTIFTEEEAEDWCSRHQQSCLLSIFVRVEL